MRRERFQLFAAFDETGQLTADCSCPYDWGGDCKHVIALLLTFLHEPELFRASAALREELASLAKEDLIDIIGQMNARYTGLEDIIEGMINHARKNR